MAQFEAMRRDLGETEAASQALPPMVVDPWTSTKISIAIAFVTNWFQD
jgi:hypothetical protein